MFLRTEQLVVAPIGVATTGFPRVEDCPASAWNHSSVAQVDIFPEFCSSLDGIRPGDRLFVVWWMDDADRSVRACRPDPHSDSVGIFASRCPHRPNPIGLTVVRVAVVGDARLDVVGLECRSGSLVLDLKPVIVTKAGDWL